MARPSLPMGAEAERARLRAADEDGVAWRTWTIASHSDEAQLLVADRRGSTRLVIRMASRTPGTRVRTSTGRIETLPVAALPSGAYTCVAAVLTGDEGQAPVTAILEVACRGPEDVVIRLSLANPAPAPMRVTLGVELTTPDEAMWWLRADPRFEPDTRDPLRLSATIDLGPDGRHIAQLRFGRGGASHAALGLDANATLGTRAREAEAFVASLVDGDADSPELARAAASLASLLLTPPTTTPVEDAAMDALALALADASPAKSRLLQVIGSRTADDGAFHPPIDAWAALRICELEETATGRRDRDFLERAFQMLLDDFARWMDRLDETGRNALQGGVIGLDTTSGAMDGTLWTGCYCVWMLSLAVELAREDPAYEDVAATFLEMSLSMVAALQDLGGAGLLPLVAVALLPGSALARAPEVSVRIDWALRHQAALGDAVVRDHRKHGGSGDALVALVGRRRRRAVLQRLPGPGAHPSAMLAVLLFDAVDRVRAFERAGHHGSGPSTERLAHWLDGHLQEADGHTTPPWVPLLTGALRRSS